MSGAYELSTIVAATFNKSSQTGTVRVEWLTAVVSPFPSLEETQTYWAC